ncbi:MAG: undecaprenyl-diphosphooligosaccharide---protein glycotransferase [Deferribacteres bacterium]|jgi:dolichyl-diphosphooligosaccharide--protein glycosyltransferase|nr:undecaprenyl-diphosphooligosaccharide---protein glycotransferase [Deferribacteres bacterium]
MKKISFLIVFVSILVVYFLSGYKRYEVYKGWEKNRDIYFVDNITAMTTLDAYYWLKMAKDFDEGKLGKDYLDPLKEFPDMRCYKDRPNMLVWLISFTHKITGLDYYKSGLALIPILAGLFCIPLFFYFFKVDYGESAILGGLLGSFSFAYYVRSTMGRVDTDLLNIFFPILVSLFVLFIKKDNSKIKNYAFSAIAGISMAGFIWWYEKPGFIFVYIVFLAAYLLFQKTNLKESAILIAIFTIFSGPMNVYSSIGHLIGFLQNYFFPKPTGQIAWPDIMQTITESQKRGFVETLQMIHQLWGLTIIGFAGLFYLYYKKFIQMIPITPVVILGMLSLVGSNRFAMFLVPFVGIGIGVVVTEMLKYIQNKLKTNHIITNILNVCIMFIIFFSTVKYTAYSYILRPSIAPDITKSFLELKQKLPENSAVFTWWDYGYALMDIPEFATYHDGGAHGGLRTTLVAIGLSEKSQQKLYNLLSYLDEYGFDYLREAIVKDNISADEMLKNVFGYNNGFKGDKTYILYTRDMIGKFGAISFFGNWDFKDKKSSPVGYNELNCSKIENGKLYCAGITIDMGSGLAEANGKNFFLKKIIYVNNGFTVNSQQFKDYGNILQILMKNNRIFSIQIINEELFNTNFNQQYILGNYDKNLFREVYNNYPTARVFEVLKK